MYPVESIIKILLEAFSRHIGYTFSINTEVHIFQIGVGDSRRLLTLPSPAVESVVLVSLILIVGDVGEV
jgi:hypothetical protein